MRFASGVVALAAVGLAVSVSAKKERDFKKELESWSSVIAELQQVDEANASTQEIERIRNLVSQGQAFLAADETDEIAPLVDHAAALAALVRARAERIAVETKAKEAEIAAEAAEAAAAKARAEAQAAQNKFDQLEAKGL